MAENLAAQVAGTTVTTGGVTSTVGTVGTVVSTNPVVAATVATLTASAVTIGLGQSELQRVGIAIPVPNNSATPLQVLGVQASGDIFVEDYPKTVPANSSANMTVMYYATGSTSGGTDLVRVLTSTGAIVIPVNHGRTQAVTLSGTSLSWAIGQSGVKSVTLTVTGGATVPMAAHALGSGNSATIVSLGNGSYRIDVQPGTTAKASSFPVIVDLNPALPDVTVAISCTVGL